MKRAAAVFRLLRLCAAVVFGVGMLFVPAEDAVAQTSPRDCASENRLAHDSDDSKCGACTSDRFWDGTNCVTESGGFDRGTFQADCTGVSANYWPLDADGDDTIKVDACLNIGPQFARCYLVLHPDFDPDTHRLDNTDGDTFHTPGVSTFTRCLDVAAYGACTSPMVKKNPGNPFSDCVAPSEVACGEGEYNDNGTCRCAAGFEPDGSGGCDACTGGRTSEATTSTTDGMCACSGLTSTLDSTGTNCVGVCPLGQFNDVQSDPRQCKVCPSGTYSQSVGSQCTSCANGVTGDVQNGGATSCACNQGFEKNEFGECLPEIVRTVAISLAVNGTLAAKWSGDPDLADGDTVPDGTRVTFIATPDAGFYVTLWTGCASDIFTTGGHEDGGEKECVATADADLTVAVVFADIDECEILMNGFKGGCHPSGHGVSGRDGCTDNPVPNADPICKCGPEFPKGDGRTCLVKCPAGSGGDMCDEDLPKVEMVVPSGGATLHATPEADCYVQGWTDSACADATGSSGETGSAGRKSCVSSGTGMVTVGVYFDCGP